MGIIHRLRGIGASNREGDSSTRRVEEMLKDDERVKQLLLELDGFAWQSEIATVLDWSPVKTSRIVSRMEAENAVTRYRIGRRKVVCLPEMEPAGLRGNPTKALAQ